MAGGTRLGETPGYVREVGLTQKFVKGASGNALNLLEYQGFAFPGTATSAALWAIRKFTYDSTGFNTDIQWAGGTDGFDNVMDNYASFTYS